jgi:hypothetical protein
MTQIVATVAPAVIALAVIRYIMDQRSGIVVLALIIALAALHDIMEHGYGFRGEFDVQQRKGAIEMLPPGDSLTLNPGGPEPWRQ